MSRTEGNAAVTASTGVAAIEAELALEGAQLTKVRDRALQVAGAVGYGATAEVRNFLSRFELPQDGDVTVTLPDGFSPEHYSEAGLAHQLDLVKERHATKLAGIRSEALRYYQLSRITLDQLNGFLEYAGLEPVASHSSYSFSGTLRLSSELDQGAVTRALQTALAGVEGVSEVDTSGVRVSRSTHVH